MILLVFKGVQLILSDAENASFIGSNFSQAELYGTSLAGSFLWGVKAPSVSAFAFGNLREAIIDRQEMPLALWPKRLLELDNRIGNISKGKQFESWKAGNDYAILAAARKTLYRNKEYEFLQSSIAFARSIACELDLEFMEELVLAFELSSQVSDYFFGVLCGARAPVRRFSKSFAPVIMTTPTG